MIDLKNTFALDNLWLVCEKLNKIVEPIIAYENLLQIKTEYDDAGERLDKPKKLRHGKHQKKIEPRQTVGAGKP